MIRPSACFWLVLAGACTPENELKSLNGTPTDPTTTPTPTTTTTPTVATTLDTGTTATVTSSTPTTLTTSTTLTVPTGTTTTPTGTTTTGVCTPSSWRDTLPALPAAVPLPANLAIGSGATLGTCTNDPEVVTDVADTSDVATVQAHVGGQWYFEIRPDVYVAGWSMAGVFADPAADYDVIDLGNPGTYPWAAAGEFLNGTVLGVAADLDAGVVGLYENGVRVGSQDVSLDPGVGAFHAGGVSMIGNQLRFDFGSEPFSYDPPAGYAAWSTGATGNCPSDAVIPAPPAPIVLDGSLSSGATTFLSDAAAPIDLVMVGVYDSGSVTGWTWGPTGPVPNGTQANGAVTVHLDHTAPTALVLTAYEPTDWTLDLDAAADLRSVTVYAMHPQTVAGVPSGVPVDIHTICTNGSGGWCTGYTGENFPVGSFQWPFDDGGGATQDQVDLAEAATCLPLKMFGGIYDTQDIEVD